MVMRGSQTDNGRVCMKCGLFKEASAFDKNGKRADGSVRLRSICKDCGSRRKLVETKTEKRCNDCGRVKPISEFNSGGRRSYCRECGVVRSDAYKKGKGRQRHIDRMCRYQKEKYASDPEYRQKRRARSAVRRAVLKGELEKPDRCPRCGREVRLQAHHLNGYDKEHQLDVEWMCGKCHYAEEHK